MNLLARIQLLNDLIRSKSTGNADQLARQLNVSTRTVYKDIQWMRAKGAPIVFARQYESYIYEQDVTFLVAFVHPGLVELIRNRSS